MSLRDNRRWQCIYWVCISTVRDLRSSIFSLQSSVFGLRSSVLSLRSLVTNPRSFPPWSTLLATALITASVVGVFGPALVTDQSFAFRDAAHFYYPLFYWTAKQWKSAELPLWNPQEDLGSPVIADATSSVFYPGKVLLLMPGDFATWYKLFIVGHVIICGITSFRLARHWKASEAAATLCAISYCLGGHVLFQYCNVVYLVGAAWLPLAIQTGDSLLQKGGWRRAAGLAICLSMMVLGGDAQAAYHTGLLLLTLAWMRRRQWRAPGRYSRRRAFGGPAVSGLVGPWRLVVAGALAVCLAAVQWLPSAVWIRESTRASFTTPRTLYEIPEYVRRKPTGPHTDAWQSLAAVTQDGSHHNTVFDFSVEPWRVLELIWPNLGGQIFPQNHRWMSVIPAAARVWTPSLYMGLIPLLVAGLAFRLRGGTVQRRWLSWCALVSVLGSFGYYGAGWLIREILFDLGSNTQLPVGAPFGGVYWLGTVLLPGYILFRYPAKLWVIAALGISQLAALGWDASVRKRMSPLKWPLVVIGVLSGLGFVFLLTAPVDWEQLLRSVPGDSLFGPFDVAGARSDVLHSLGHAMLLATVCYAVLRSFGGTSARRWSWLLVGFTAVELVMAQHALVPLAPTKIWHQPSTLANVLPRESPVPTRVFRGQAIWYPAAWRHSSSPDRLAEGLAWDRNTLFPKHHLLGDFAVVESRHSMRPAYWAAMLQAASEPVDAPGSGVPKGLLRQLGVDLMVTPPTPLLHSDGSFRRLPLEGDGDALFWRSATENPRVWIVHEVERVPPVDPRNWPALLDRCGNIVRRDEAGVPRDLSTSAVVEVAMEPDEAEISEPETDPISGQNKAAEFDEEARITDYDATRMTLVARLNKPGLVVLNDTFASGWHATVHRRGGAAASARIHRTNGIMRGIFLPAGEFEIHLAYRPQEFCIGMFVSGLAWTACLLYLIVHLGFHFVRRIGTQS